jgi:hypothetical protein
MPNAHFPPYPRVPHSSGQARIRLAGKRVYLGKYKSPESRARYDQLRDAWLLAKSVDRATLTIDELALRFLEHAITYYTKDGVPTSEVACIKSALRPLVTLLDRLKVFLARHEGQIPLGLLDLALNLFESIALRILDRGCVAFRLAKLKH